MNPQECRKVDTFGFRCSEAFVCCSLRCVGRICVLVPALIQDDQEGFAFGCRTPLGLHTAVFSSASAAN